MQQLFTSRLTLTAFQPDEIELFYRINTDPFVREYLWDDQSIDRNTAEELLKQNQKHFAEDRFGLWKIVRKDSSEIIGYTGLWYFFDEPQPQLIYALLPEFSQQGYATEAAQAVIKYAFENLSFTYLIAATDEPHMASQKVAKRLGMHYLETRKEHDKSTVFFRIENIDAKA